MKLSWEQFPSNHFHSKITPPVFREIANDSFLRTKDQTKHTLKSGKKIDYTFTHYINVHQRMSY